MLRQPSGDKDEGASICWCLLPTVVRSAHCNEEDMPTVMRFGVGYVYVDILCFTNALSLQIFIPKKM